jgi:hypothetical protein
MINCSNAVQEKKDQQEASKVDSRNFDTREKSVACKTRDTYEANGQETIEEESVFESKFG